MPAREEIAALLNERLEERLDRVQSATVPVYLESRSILQHIGSGVLVRIGSEGFLFTAAHVADFRLKGTLYLGGESSPIRMGGTVTHTRPPQDDRLLDTVDAAVIHLADEVTRYVRDHEFLDINELDVTLGPRYDDYFLVAGFPCTKQRFVPADSAIEALIYPFVAVSKLESTYGESSLDPTHHILLGFNKKDMWRRDLGRVTAPNLYGVSGGGIWWLPEYEGMVPEPPRLHAIAVEWHRGARRRMLGTRINVFLSAVYRDFPTLRDVMR